VCFFADFGGIFFLLIRRFSLKGIGGYHFFGRKSRRVP
jgi:hypothetical protein